MSMNQTLVTAMSMGAGIASWSFAEYHLHRFLGHACKGRNRFSREHLAHHSDPTYFAPTWQKAIVAVTWFAAVFALSTHLVGTEIALPYSVSFAAMYTFYEVVHRRIHTHAPGPLRPHGSQTPFGTPLH